MNPQQKTARFNLIVISLALGLFAIAFMVLYQIAGPKAARGAFGVLGLLGLLGLSPLFYRKKKREQKVVLDERDGLIGQRASLIAGVVAYLYFVAACMVPWAVLRMRAGMLQDVAISIEWLPLILVGGALFLVGTWSVAILIQYGKESGDVEG
jgi:hypothetical protein